MDFSNPKEVFGPRKPRTNKRESHLRKSELSRSKFYSEERRSENDRNVESIRNSASNLLLRFKDKLANLEGNEEITRLFIRNRFDKKRCLETSKRFFGASEVHYIAIDGTKFEEPRLDMLIFYAGAFAYSGTTSFLEDEEIVSEPPSSAVDYLSLGSAIPLSEEYSSKVFGELGGGGVEYDLSNVSTSIMRLAEYYLAYRALSSDPKLGIVLMDRTVSGDIAHTSWKLRDYVKEGSSILTGFDTTFGKISQVDLELGRMLISNTELNIPAPRSQFIGFATIALLMREGPLTMDQILKKLGADERRSSKIKKELEEKILKDAITRSGSDGKYEPKAGMDHYWDRLLEGALYFADHIFAFAESDHPLRIEDPISRVDRWLTFMDIDYLTLIFITEILRLCWSRRILLLGIVKDSAANELVRTVIPMLENADLVSKQNSIEAFGSDTMLLQANSIVNSSITPTPWRTFEYDVCFRTISPEKSNERGVKGECGANGAYKNVIAPERMFVKAYFQLWNSEENPALRSHVFLYDRPCFPGFDNTNMELKIINRDADVDEEIFPALHFLFDSDLAELSIGILDSMGKEAIPEALGHNYPLFLADKRAKLAEDEASKSCIAAVELEITKSRLDQQILYQEKFRDMRSGVESLRKRRRKQP